MTELIPSAPTTKSALNLLPSCRITVHTPPTSPNSTPPTLEHLKTPAELDGPVELTLVQGRPVEIPEGGTVRFCVLGKVHVRYMVASPANHVYLLGQGGISEKGFTHAPCRQDL